MPRIRLPSLVELRSLKRASLFLEPPFDRTADMNVSASKEERQPEQPIHCCSRFS